MCNLRTTGCHKDELSFFTGRLPFPCQLGVGRGGGGVSGLLGVVLGGTGFRGHLLGALQGCVTDYLPPGGRAGQGKRLN